MTADQIERAMRDAILKRAHERVYLGEAELHESPYPKFIYLGKAEFAACEECFRRAGVVSDPTGKDKRTFMGVEVLTVNAETHLQVSSE